MTASASTSTVPKRVLWKVTMDMEGSSLWIGSAEEVQEGGLQDVGPHLEGGLVGGLLRVELDQRLRDVSVLRVGELRDRGLLDLRHAAQRRVEPVLAGAVERP